MNTEITNAINASKDKAQYDTHAKRLLSQKIILAHILVKVIDEFKDMKPEQVMAYIEGDPIIGTIRRFWTENCGIKYRKCRY